MSEESYDSEYEWSEEENSDSSYDENDEFYEGDEELKGGSYQLSTDYLDSMGMGYGGELYGGARRKNCLSDYNLFFKYYRKKGLTPKQIGAKWRSGAKMPRVSVPKNRVRCAQTKRRRKAPVKKHVTRRTTRKKSGSKVGRKCASNNKYYKLDSNYKKFCKELQNNYLYNVLESNKCASKGMRYCPLTGKCRKLPESIVDCYTKTNLPYFYKNGIPTARSIPIDEKLYYMNLDNFNNSNRQFKSDTYFNDRLIKKKTL